MINAAFSRTDSRSFYDDFALGVVGSGISFSCGYVAMKSTEHFLEKYDLVTRDQQNHYFIFDSLEAISNVFLRGLLKSIAVVLIVFIMPIAEEWVFRDLLYQRQEARKAENETTGEKLYRVISNGVIFGAFHFHPARGLANLPGIVANSITGIGFAALRERTGNHRASTFAHILISSLFVGNYYLGL